MAQIVIPATNCPELPYCTGGCCEWTLTNEGPSTITFNYTDCDGNAASIILGAGQTSEPFCGSGVTDYDLFSLTYQGCCSDCNCYDGITDGQYSYWNCNGIRQTGNTTGVSFCYDHYKPYSGITTIGPSETCVCSGTTTPTPTPTPTATPTPTPTATPFVIAGYNCISGNCVGTSGPSQYATLQECIDDGCSYVPPTPTPTDGLTCASVINFNQTNTNVPITYLDCCDNLVCLTIPSGSTGYVTTSGSCIKVGSVSGSVTNVTYEFTCVQECPDSCLVKDYDIVLLFDESSSIDSTEFSLMMQAARNLITILSSSINSSNGIQIGLASFATGSAQILQLSSDVCTISNAITNNAQSGGLTNLYSGLTVAYNTLTGSTNTRNVNKKIIVYTDGNPTAPLTGNTENKNLASAQAQTIKSALYNGIYTTEIICIGIGNGVDINYLKNSIASVPYYVIQVDNFQGIIDANFQIASLICSPSPCCPSVYVVDTDFLLQENSSAIFQEDDSLIKIK